MSEVTESLLQELLEEPITVAIYGGGFKPPTKGHFTVVEKTLNDFPEIDELKIFVGGGVRDGITQDESIQIWDIYKKYLSDKVDIEPSVAPVKSVLGYAKDHPEEKIYWILGAREGDEGDLADIENRTRSIEKYPNLEVKVITTAGGVSGTKTRAAIKSGNKEQFFHLIPDVSEEEKNQIWGLVEPVIKEGFIEDIKTKLQKFISSIKQEGKETKEAVSLLIKAAKGNIELSDEQKEQIGNQLKDVLKTIGLTAIAALPGGFIAGALIKLFKAEALITPSAFATEGTCGYDTDVTTGKKLDTPGGLEEGKQVGPLYHYTSADGLKGILNSNRINASEEYYLGNDLYYISFTRNKNFHNKGSKFGVKTDYRITLDGDKLSNRYKITPFAYKPGWNYEDNWEYDWLEDEPESVVRDFFNNTGDYDEQEERISFKGPEGGIDNIKNYILSVDKVEDLQEGRKKKPDPKKGTGKKPEGSGRRLYTDEDPKDTVGISFKTKEDIVDTLNKASFKSKSHARQSQIINLIHQRVRAAYGKAKDPEVKARLKRGLDYIESRKEASKKKTERLRKMKEASDPQAGTALPYGSGFAPVKELVTATQVICDNCGWEWDKKDGGKDLYICHKCGHNNTPTKSDPFGLNELARQIAEEVGRDLTKGWNPQDNFVSLAVFMRDNGMNVTPLPKIKVIKDDKENASDLLGKTAYYNPQEKSITLYTFGRHPKDVLRSFAHEMVHHEQNLNGTLGNITTTNTSEDGNLDKIEREAYEKGNIMLRNWEDSIKNV